MFMGLNNVLVDPWEQKIDMHSTAELSWLESNLDIDDSLLSGASLWTHSPLDKMAAILADNIFKLIFLNEMV